MKVSFSSEAKTDFARLGPTAQVAIRKKIKTLSKWPGVSGWKPMRKDWAGSGRLRVGDWRVVFRVPKPGDDTMVVAKICHRSAIYDD